MNEITLTEIDRKISLFQKAVEEYARAKTLQNAQAVAKAKKQLTMLYRGGHE